MKSDYYNTEEGSHITLLDAGPIGWIVTFVSVKPPEKRGKGAASRLLDEVCKEADLERVRLLLTADPDESDTGLGVPALQAFYQRHGFEFLSLETGVLMIRDPLENK